MIWFPDEDADNIDGYITPKDPWEDTRLLQNQLGPYGDNHHWTTVRNSKEDDKKD